jgi:hypothetical protein
MDNIKTYKYWEDLFNTNQLNRFNNDKYGLLWLKIKAINRKENHILNDFCEYVHYEIKSMRLSDTFPDLRY